MPALLVDIGANIARLTADVAKANTSMDLPSGQKRHLPV
jgi:hypothetical protein